MGGTTAAIDDDDDDDDDDTRGLDARIRARIVRVCQSRGREKSC